MNSFESTSSFRLLKDFKTKPVELAQFSGNIVRSGEKRWDENWDEFLLPVLQKLG